MQITLLVHKIVAMDNDHENCPWHEEGTPPSGSLKGATPEDDVTSMQENSSGDLTVSLEPVLRQPANLVVNVGYARQPELRTVGAKKVAVYEESDPRTYEASYAAHHIIPGKEALKGHRVVEWLGGEGQIAEGQKNGKPKSRVVDGQFIGYDINAKENGIWLPGPYPLSTVAGHWPDAKAAKAAKVEAQTRAFKTAYAVAVMKAARKPYDRAAKNAKPYLGCQLHYRHTAYSKLMKLMLTKIRLKVLHFSEECPRFKEKKPDKYPAPLGLKARLEGVSERVRPFLAGPKWSRFIYTDDLSRNIIDV